MATIELRCEGTLHGRLTDGRWLEVSCRRRRCGYSKGKVILHTIDILTGEVVRTKQFRNPDKQRKEGHDASHHPSAAVRAS